MNKILYAASVYLVPSGHTVKKYFFDSFGEDPEHSNCQEFMDARSTVQMLSALVSEVDETKLAAFHKKVSALCKIPFLKEADPLRTITTNNGEQALLAAYKLPGLFPSVTFRSLRKKILQAFGSQATAVTVSLQFSYGYMTVAIISKEGMAGHEAILSKVIAQAGARPCGLIVCY